MTFRHYIYLPMEIAARELDARLLVAQLATRGDVEVVLGQKWLMETNLAAMPPGVWLFKTMTPRDSRVMEKILAHGHAIAAIDEEVTALAEGTGGLTWVSGDGVAQAHRIFCQGEEHYKSMTARWPEYAQKYHVTGNPRWDLLRPELRSIFDANSAALRAKHGRIILINTNSSVGNPVKGKSGEQLLQELADAGKISLATEEDRAKWAAYLAFDRANMEATLGLVRALANRHPGHFIVVRPHPSEEGDFYRRGLGGISNAGVIFEGSAATWIAAADVLVHTQCTTGIEALAQGKPAINFEVAPSPVNTRNISGRLSIIARSEREVLELVARRLAGDDPKADLPQGVDDTFKRFFAAQEGELAAARIVRELEALAHETGLGVEAPADAAVWRPNWNFRPRWRMTRHRRKVFPPVEMATLQARLAVLAAALGEGDPATVTGVGDCLFHLRRRDLSPPPVGSAVGRIAGRLMGRR